jgi:pilus assembly protein CpaB
MSSPRTRATQFGAIGFAAIALGCAAFVAFLAARMVKEKGYTNDRLLPLIVARHPLPAAQPITEADLMIVNWPEKSYPAGGVAEVAELLNDKHPAPVPTTAILEGEPVVPSRLARSDQGTGIAALLRPGYRAVAVKVDEVIWRSGLLYPGAYVDVLTTFRDPMGRGPSTRIAVANIRVLAVESETDVQTRPQRRTEEGAPIAAATQQNNTVVTLEVSPADSEVLSLATQEGKIDLALRNGSDHEVSETAGATPAAFSAFPIEVTVDDSVATAPKTPDTKKRHMEIKAIDPAKRDVVPPAGGNIETYHAPK